MSQESGCMDVSEALDICGAQCLTRWVADQRVRRQHYSLNHQWHDDQRPVGWQGRTMP